MKINSIIKISSLVIALMSVVSCTRTEYRQVSGVVWNTLYHITYESDKDLSDSILSVFNRIDNSVSAFNPNSVVSAVNKNISFIIDDDFKRVYNAALCVNEVTGKEFDPTLSPLINLYGYGYKSLPDKDTVKVAEILQYIGIEKTHLNGNTLTKDDDRIEFNFSGLAKGYGVDLVAESLHKNNCGNYLVEIGGEIRTSGHRAGGGKWRVSIEDPRVAHDNAVARDVDKRMTSQPQSDEVATPVGVTVIEVGDVGLATSGNYRNFKQNSRQGRHHTISRFSGESAVTEIASVTVIIPASVDDKYLSAMNPEARALAKKMAATPCMYADALATGLLAMGLDKAKMVAEEYHIPIFVITSDNEVYESKAFRQCFVK